MILLLTFLLITLAIDLICYFLTPLSPFVCGIKYLWFPFANYLVTFAILIATFLLFAWFISLFYKNDSERKKTNRFGMWFTKNALQAILILLGGRVKITGKEKLPKKETFVVIANHLSAYDILAFSYLPGRLIFISKPENFAIPIGGGWMRLAGYVSLERDNPISGLRAILRGAKICEEGRANVIIFPEGTRSKDHHLQEFKAGSFKLATSSHKKMAVIAIRNTENVKKNIGKHFSKIKLDVLKVYSEEEIASYKTTALSEEAHELIRNFLSRKL